MDDENVKTFGKLLTGISVFPPGWWLDHNWSIFTVKLNVAHTQDQKMDVDQGRSRNFQEGDCKHLLKKKSSSTWCPHTGRCPVSVVPPYSAPVEQKDTINWFPIPSSLDKQLIIIENIIDLVFIFIIFITETTPESPDHYVLGHCIDGRVLYPATGYLCLAWRALARLHNTSQDQLPVEFKDVTIHQATIMPKEGESWP